MLLVGLSFYARYKLSLFEVLAGGFSVQQYFHPANYTGRNGTTFAKEWEKDGARSYLGLVNPDFPNFCSF